MLTSIPDANEPDVSDGYDVESISFYKDGDNLKIVVKFYANYAYTDPSPYFAIPVDTVSGGLPEIRITCKRSFVSAQPNAGGAYLYWGTPVISGSTYTITFPYENVFGGYDTIYPWLVSYGLPTMEAVSQFTVDWPVEGSPPAPTLSSPANGANVYTNTPLLSVEPVTGADLYAYYLYDQTDATVVDSSVSASSTYACPTLVYGHSYSWKVMAHNSVDWGPYSATWTFTSTETVVPAGALESVFDANEADIPDGRDVQSINFYREGANLKIIVTFYANYAFADLVYFAIPVDTILGGVPEIEIRCKQSWVAAQLKDGGANLYYGTPTISGNTYTVVFPYEDVFGGYDIIYPWLVSYPAPGETFEAVPQFTVDWPMDDVPLAPLLMNPSNGVNVYTNTPLLTIHPVTGASQYTYELYDQTDATLVDSSVSSSTAYTCPTLVHGHSYSWKVKAYNTYGWGPWSETWTFYPTETVVPLGAIKSVSDPNEVDIPDGRDIQSINFYKDGSNLKIIVTFYENYAFADLVYFAIPVDTELGGVPEIVIRCKQSWVAAELNDGGTRLYYGTPTISGNTYTVSFPYDDVFGGYDTLYPWAVTYPAPAENFDAVQQFTVLIPPETPLVVPEAPFGTTVVAFFVALLLFGVWTHKKPKRQ
ncbi:MAG: hypothetical protein NWE92_13615 [Candidatus Bathyarchaeota archaeon]|nr:hypothetical protein [Candidatus Bathyarchaeota archaeon]